MIIRQWKARASAEGAEEYRRHFAEAVYPELIGIEGFEGAQLFARKSGGDVELTVETRWASMDAIRSFAGADTERAVVEPRVADIVKEFDRHVSHHDCLFEG